MGQPLCRQKVTICALFHSVFCIFHAKSCCLWGREKKLCFADYLCCYVSLNQALFRSSSLNLKIFQTEMTPLRLLNKCSKICVILDSDQLECFQGPKTYCPVLDKGLLSTSGQNVLFLIANQQNASSSLLTLFSKIQIYLFNFVMFTAMFIYFDDSFLNFGLYFFMNLVC